MAQDQGPVAGHDGPYPAPVMVEGFTVSPDWIDYNGHMNVGYYGVVFDLAFEEVLTRHLGMGGDMVESIGQGPFILQSHLQFLSEVREGAPLRFEIHLLDHDHKRGHYFQRMLSKDGTLCATQEAVFMNVSHATGRSAPYPDWAQTRLAQMARDHARLEPAPQVGAQIGLRRG